MYKDLVNSKSAIDFVYTLSVLVLLIILSAFVIKYLWNRVLVPHVTILKPLDTLTEALLMSIAISIVRGY